MLPATRLLFDTRTRHRLRTFEPTGNHNSRRSVSSRILCLAACVAAADGQRARKCRPGLLMVGSPGASQLPAPTDPGVTVSRHRALLTGRQ